MLYPIELAAFHRADAERPNTGGRAASRTDGILTSCASPTRGAGRQGQPGTAVGCPAALQIEKPLRVGCRQVAQVLGGYPAEIGQEPCRVDHVRRDVGANVAHRLRRQKG